VSTENKFDSMVDKFRHKHSMALTEEQQQRAEYVRLLSYFVDSLAILGVNNINRMFFAFSLYTKNSSKEIFLTDISDTMSDFDKDYPDLEIFNIGNSTDNMANYIIDGRKIGYQRDQYRIRYSTLDDEDYDYFSCSAENISKCYNVPAQIEFETFIKKHSKISPVYLGELSGRPQRHFGVYRFPDIKKENVAILDVLLKDAGFSHLTKIHRYTQNFNINYTKKAIFSSKRNIYKTKTIQIERFVLEINMADVS
jgi:hypothetical protein